MTLILHGGDFHSNKPRRTASSVRLTGVLPHAFDLESRMEGEAS